MGLVIRGRTPRCRRSRAFYPLDAFAPEHLHRWVRGSATYGTDLTSYRTYLVNHEVGHGLGHRHVSCPAPGRPAPIMVQQTLGLEGCRAWPWPTQQ